MSNVFILNKLPNETFCLHWLESGVTLQLFMSGLVYIVYRFKVPHWGGSNAIVYSLRSALFYGTIHSGESAGMLGLYSILFINERMRIFLFRKNIREGNLESYQFNYKLYHIPLLVLHSSFLRAFRNVPLCLVRAPDQSIIDRQGLLMKILLLLVLMLFYLQVSTPHKYDECSPAECLRTTTDRKSVV